MKVAAQILYHARSSPDRPALAFVGATATYGMLGRGVTTTCRFLRAEGLSPGMTVAIEVGNPIHHIALILALEIQGVTSISVLTRHALAEAGLRVDALLIDSLREPDPTIRTIRVDDAWFAMAPAIDIDLTGGLKDGQYYRIILSSGTTGKPKAVGYTSALVGTFMMRTSILRGDTGHRSLSLMGFSTLGFLTPIITMLQGQTACIAGTADEALLLTRTLGVQWIGYVTAAFLEQLVKAARDSSEPLFSLRAILVSGSKVPRALVAEAQARLCPNIIASYASTEAGIMSHMRLGRADEVEGSAGYVLPWVAIETIGADGTTLPAGQEGVIRIRSPDIAEYVLPPGAPGQISPNDWFTSGDIGRLRPDGLLIVTGRTSEVINRGGVIVAPDYIERVIEGHPDVREAAVFVLSDPDGLDTIWAAIVPEGSIDPSAILASIRPTLVDKTPDGIVTVAAIPRTDTGKIRRATLRDDFLAHRAPTV